VVRTVISYIHVDLVGPIAAVPGTRKQREKARTRASKLISAAWSISDPECVLKYQSYPIDRARLTFSLQQ